MFHRSFAALVLSAAPMLAACGVLPDLTLGKSQGIPPISGSTTIDIPTNYMCGDPITDPAKKYTVTTSGTNDKCTFTFRQDVTALKASDYDGNPELKGATLVRAVDIEVSKLGVRDAGTMMTLTPLDLTGKAFGSTILTKADLAKPPPFTKRVEGPAVDALKSKIEAKADVVIPVEVALVVALTPTPPTKIALDYDAQPNLVIGF